MEQIDDELQKKLEEEWKSYCETVNIETPEAPTLWEDNKRVAKRNAIALMKALWWVMKIFLKATVWLLSKLCQIFRRIAEAIKDNPKITLTVIVITLTVLDLWLWAYSRTTEARMQYRIDSLELRCDTLKDCSLYDIGYRDGLLYGNSLAVGTAEERMKQ